MRHEAVRLRALAWLALAALLAGSVTIFLPVTRAAAAGSHGAAQMAQAKKALLVLKDLPKGWTSSKSSNSNSPTPGADQLAQCLGVPVSEVNNNAPTVYSPEFDSKNKLETVDDNVSIYASAKAARANFATATNPKATNCMRANVNGPGKSALDSSFGSGASVGSITVTRTPSRDYAPHSANLTIFFPVTVNEVTLNVEIIEVGYLKGNEQQTLTFVSVETPFPTALARHLTTVASGRL
jgi:hypothetical protein